MGFGLPFLGGFSSAATRSQGQNGDQLVRAIQLLSLKRELEQDQLRQAAMSKLPADQQQELMLGGSIEDIKNRASRESSDKATAAAIANEIDLRANDPSLSPASRQQLQRLSPIIRANPSAAKDLTSTLKLFGIGGTSTKPYVPNAVSARAMQILGTTDPAVLAQHPEALVKAQQENIEDQKRIAREYRPPPQPPAETPVSPSDIVKLPDGRVGYWAHARGSKPTFVETPGATPKAEEPPKPKQWTAKDAVSLYDTVYKQVKEEKAGRLFNARPPEIRQKAIQELNAAGYDVRGGGAWPRKGTAATPMVGDTVDTD